MKLQIIESISKHAVTLVLVIGILMLTDKGIMPTGIKDSIYLFHCRTPVFLTNKTNRYENKYMYIFCSCHAGCMATERTNQTGQKTSAQYS